MAERRGKERGDGSLRSIAGLLLREALSGGAGEQRWGRVVGVGGGSRGGGGPTIDILTGEKQLRDIAVEGGAKSR